MKNMFKRVALLLFCSTVAYTQRADAVAGNWAVEGVVTNFSILDKALETSGSTERILEITFNAAGNECGNARAAGYGYTISSTVSNNTFDDFVKLAQTAYLSGRTLRYSTAKRTSTSNCAAWFMQLK
jgi:hypothetical protein